MDRFALVAPLLRRLAPETAHDLTLWALARGLGPRAREPDDPILAGSLWGLDFANPIGLAAGFDKNAVAPQALFDLGLGFVEVGSVTPQPQAGNPKPRVFRLPAAEAVINRLGFPSEGMAAVARRLGARQPGPLGINLGKNKESAAAAADYAAAAARLARHADYLVINVSSPNTPGLRALQGRGELEAIIAEVRAALGPAGGTPLLVKIAPDLEAADLADIAAVALGGTLDGLIATNTTVARPAGLPGRHAAEAGGLSGQPLFERSTQVLGELYRLTEGRVPLIGVGGVASGAQAYAKIRAGASLVQLYTGLVYGGPGLVGRIKRELAACLRRDGFASVGAAVGSGARGR